MPKAMSIAGMAIAGLTLVVFLADLALGIPFGGANMMMDIGFVLGAAILTYLGFNAFRDAA
ncbi:hypothetical protein Mal64_32710 [Pseudobythopirellula maris]|uniref:Uncharacterized protein n=1 Tax=Pseudobythopirellula maris TaxID=2527991 RepID=A0A5C5ZKP4_9BACT|nr:hypothetical protein [Pseudobythopirellula maris]TWT87728.1 hypothetical protein Mal64_32710 [Pseudobythopirellula maris]